MPTDAMHALEHIGAHSASNVYNASRPYLGISRWLAAYRELTKHTPIRFLVASTRGK